MLLPLSTMGMVVDEGKVGRQGEMAMVRASPWDQAGVVVVLRAQTSGQQRTRSGERPWQGFDVRLKLLDSVNSPAETILL